MVSALKAALLTQGVVVSASARERLTAGGALPLSVGDYATTSGLNLWLSERSLINVPFAESFCAASRFALDWDGELLWLTGGEEPLAVRCDPLPGYLGRVLSSGEPVTEVAMTHGDRVRLSPIDGCSNACRFCDLPARKTYRLRTPGILLEALQHALDDRQLPVRHALLSGGHPRAADLEALDATYERLIAACPVPMDVMLAAREDTSVLERLSDCGAWGLSINMELFDLASARTYMPTKHAGSTDGFLRFVEHAVKVFGAGTGRVRSLLLVGLSSLEDTLRGVEALAERGCDPVLSPFRPSPHTVLGQHPPPSEPLLAEVHDRALEIAHRHGVVLGPRCLACQGNTMVVPDSSDAYFRF